MRAARAAAVLDHDRLAELRRHLLEHDARDDVGRAARPERNDRADRPRRPICASRGAAAAPMRTIKMQASIRPHARSSSE